MDRRDFLASLTVLVGGAAIGVRPEAEYARQAVGFAETKELARRFLPETTKIRFFDDRGMDVTHLLEQLRPFSPAEWKVGGDGAHTDCEYRVKEPVTLTRMEIYGDAPELGITGEVPFFETAFLHAKHIQTIDTVHVNVDLSSD